MSTHPDYPSSFDRFEFERRLPQIYRVVLKEFKRVVASLTRLHLAFAFLLAAEVAFIALFWAKLAAFAFMLSGIFLTVFSYIILLFYYQAKKPELLQNLREQFMESCRRHISAPQGVSQHHLSIADALMKLSLYLQDFESNFYRIPQSAQWASPIVCRFSSYSYGEDVFRIKQLLLEAAVDEHLQQIRATPTDLEVHASLANVYVALSKLYREAPFRKGRRPQGWNEQIHFYVGLAVEELKILNCYAPNDPWVHEQLAFGYSQLDMPEEELKEVEILVRLRPQDTEILYRLGVLYFQGGMNAKGLQVYQDMLQSNFKKAETLIAFYGKRSLEGVH